MIRLPLFIKRFISRFKGKRHVARLQAEPASTPCSLDASSSGKQRWRAARAALDAIEAARAKLVEPTQLHYEGAKAHLEDIEEEHGEPLTFCESCSDPIFEGEPYHRGSDVDLCEACAPTYGDLAQSPASFRDRYGEPERIAA